MPRASYYRKRPGYRTYMDLLWQGLWPLLEPAATDVERAKTAGQLAPDLRPEDRTQLLALLAELGEALRQDAGVARLTKATPPFFALGAGIPAEKLDRSSDLFRFATRPRGRTRARKRPPSSRPSQDDVTGWMLAAAEAESARGARIKLRAAERECMAKLGASRTQIRIAMRQLPPTMRRARGDRDRSA